MTDFVESDEYKNFFIDIKERVYKAQYDALKIVNKEHIALCRYIGSKIVEKQKLNNWGKAIVENLSNDLQGEFPGIQGFSERNLWNMRSFYLAYEGNPTLQPLVAEISWVKNIIIIGKCKDDKKREFYIRMTKKFGWTKDVLIHQIENQSYEKYLSNQTNFDKALPEKYRHQAKLAVKDEYTFDFLELGNQHSERELEIGLINNIRRFLIEMGGYFAFIGSQYKIKVGEEEFFLDLLLFHRKLKCLVVVDLKISKFRPAYTGQMQFYLAALDDQVKLEDENSSIGIIICKSKDKTVVEYALKNINTPIGVSTYKISKKLPQEIKKYFPSIEEIEKNLSMFSIPNQLDKIEFE